MTDNPLVFADTGEIVSGGNFHAEPVAFAADNLALAMAEIGALSERRIALLVDPRCPGLPPFLVANGGVNSGFMIAQVTAAALVVGEQVAGAPGQRRFHADPANQEDHVSMARIARAPAAQMAENTRASSASNCWLRRRASGARGRLRRGRRLPRLWRRSVRGAASDGDRTSRRTWRRERAHQPAMPRPPRSLPRIPLQP